MKFVKLNHTVLQYLKDNGFNILTSVSPLESENPSWIPDKVNLTDFFDAWSMEIDRRSVPVSELHLLVIDDALKNILNDDLIGQVFIGKVLK